MRIFDSFFTISVFMILVHSLFSFAKFLEVLVYSPAICTITPALCAHTSSPPPSPPSSEVRAPVASTLSSPTSTSTGSTVTSASTVKPRNSGGGADAPAPALPASRFNIIRHFVHGKGRHRVSFTLSPIDDVFELRVPRLQITRKFGDKGAASARSSIASASATSVSGGGGAGTPVDEEKRALRREIKAWWEGVADHLDKLVRGQSIK